MAVTFNSTELAALLADVGACGEIGTQMGETLYTKTFVEGDVAANYDIETGVACNSYVLTDNAKNEYDALLQVDSCALPEKDLSLSFGAEKWNPIDIGARFKVCYKDIEKGVRRIMGDPSCENTPYMPDAVSMYFEDKIAELANNNIFARAWLGETASADAWLAGFDGFLIQAQDKLSADNKITLTQNAGASYAAQKITPEQAYNYLLSMYWRAQELGIDALQNVEIKASRELINGYFQYSVENKLTNNFANVDSMKPIYDKNNLGVFGIPLKLMEYNQVAKAAGDNGTKVTNPNIAVLAPKVSLKIGTCNQDAFKAVKVWFDQKERVQNFDVEEISLDAKVVAPQNVILLV